MDARKRAGWALIAGLVFLFVVAGCQPPDAGSGSQVLSRWQPQKGASAADESEIGEIPDIQAGTHLAAGRLHESQNYLNKAIGQYRSALMRDPNCIEAHTRLGMCLGRLGNFDEAETHFRRAIELEPKKSHHRNNIAFCYMSRGLWADAEAELRNAVELSPAFVRARVNLGIVIAQQGRFDESLDAFRVVLTEADAQYNVGLMYQSARRFAEAEAAFAAALAANPKLEAAKQRLEQARSLSEHAAAQADARAAEAVAAADTPQAEAPVAAPEIVELEPVAEVTESLTMESFVETTAIDAEAQETMVAPPEPEPEQILVTISADTPASSIAALDAQDAMWLAHLDPMACVEDAERIEAVQASGIEQEGGLPFRIEVSLAAPEVNVPDVVAALPEAGTAGDVDAIVDATLVASDLFFADATGVSWAHWHSPAPEIVPFAMPADFDLPWTPATDGPRLAFPH
ncbi:MAG: tetratricopeptide repeat protein [Phycisphaerae bacterium]|nr:tetratricopeptide repeat protein [Phycisphaerae bacterium]